MHIPAPTHDRRRGSSRFKSAPGYAEADAIEDKRERALALDAVRQAAIRTELPEGVPSPHQVCAILARIIRPGLVSVA